MNGTRGLIASFTLCSFAGLLWAGPAALTPPAPTPPTPALAGGEVTAYMSGTPPVTTCCQQNIPLTTINGQQVVLPGSQSPCIATEGVSFNLTRDRITDYLPGPGSGGLIRIDERLVQPIIIPSRAR